MELNHGDRWAGIGPYYAMFPMAFASAVIERHSSPMQKVLDPFAGRGTSLYAAAVKGRSAAGVEINPVGWIYGQTKLRPAAEREVFSALERVARVAKRTRKDPALLPQFFEWCFSRRVLRFLLAARATLDWRHRTADRTLMSFILVNLHGKRPYNLSNQMRQTKAMSPNYAVRWWKKHGFSPPDINPVEYLTKRVAWRYAKGRPLTAPSSFILGDSTRVLSKLEDKGPFDLLFTSPPYFGITNYHYDQWLRLWMLGGPPYPKNSGGSYQGKFQSEVSYKRLLETVFGQAAEMLRTSGCVYVRTDSREITKTLTLEALRSAFPGWKITTVPRPIEGKTQTTLFRNRKSSPGDVDLILRHYS